MGTVRAMQNGDCSATTRRNGCVMLSAKTLLWKDISLKHVNVMTRKPSQADDFTTGQKLSLAAGITSAVSSFYSAKENSTMDETTTEA